MRKEIDKIIESYQCVGCLKGCGLSCFSPNSNGGIGCGNHLAGTFISAAGKIILGMPKGFNRVGKDLELKPNIYEKFENSDWVYDIWNRPVWKYLSPEGHTFVRGLMPRRNETFLHIFLENCLDKIDCIEITQDNVDYMD